MGHCFPLKLLVIALVWVTLPAPDARSRRPTPIIDPSGRALEQFHRSLKRSAKGLGQTRIMQYGASHTEADLFTGYLRQYFQSQFGDAGHGYVMPAQPWRGYRHQDVRIACSGGWFTDKAYRRGSRKDGLYGLAGFSVASANTKDYAWVGTTEKSAFGRRVSEFEVFYLKQPEGGSFDMYVDDEHYLTARTRDDTTELGVRTIRVSDGPHELKIQPRGDGEVRLLGVVMERRAPGVIVDSLGIRGARASVLLKWDEELWQQQIRRRNPDLVILAYGTNESGDSRQPIERYERKLIKVLSRLKIAVPTASCVLVGPTDRPMRKRGRWVHRPRLDAVVAVQKKLTARFGCGFWDSLAAMGGPLSIIDWYKHKPRLAQKDYVHLTARGYQALADDLARALLQGYR